MSSSKLHPLPPDSPEIPGIWRGSLLRKPLGRNLWEVYQLRSDPCRLYVKEFGKEYAFGTGWISDGPSIPKIACILIALGRNDLLRAGFLHDYGYDMAGLYSRMEGGPWEFEELGKKTIDHILWVGARAEGASRKQADLVHWGVSTFIGQIMWDRCRTPGLTECLRETRRFV